MSHSSDKQAAHELVSKYKTWYHRIEVYPGVVTPGINDTAKNVQILDRLGLPQSAAGKRVLDIGASDGYYSFLMEGRGASDVIVVDYRDSTTNGFHIAATLLNSKVRYRIDNVYNLRREDYGDFDIILFLGVLYHLRNPLHAFDSLRGLAKPGAHLFVETHLIDNNIYLAGGQSKPLQDFGDELLSTPIWQFYPRASLNKDATNMWAPNMAGLHAVVEEAMFNVVESEIFGSRGFVHAVAVEDEQLEFFKRLDTGYGW